MSRIGNTPIPIEDGLKIDIQPDQIVIEGPKGKLTQPTFPSLQVKQENNQLIVVNTKPDNKQSKALHGLLRSLLANMVVGVTKGWSKQLQLVGTGYRAKLQGKTLVLTVGFSHPVNIDIPEDIQIKVEKNTEITITGIDKSLVGQVAANIRAVRPPEPYKGKGIRYKDEVIRRKAGKAGKAAA
ncbi:MAG: 50S ribosomal protein L6 [bacterium]|nr:50S ribosomal protein L6 [bacterium]